MRPAVKGHSPAMARSSVLLPQPEGPRTIQRSPGAKATPSTSVSTRPPGTPSFTASARTTGEAASRCTSMPVGGGWSIALFIAASRCTRADNWNRSR